MKILLKNEFWMLLFSFGLLYWLFNSSILITPAMIIPLLFAAMSKN